LPCRLADPELRREAAAMLGLTLFEDSLEETEEPNNGLAEMLYANMPQLLTVAYRHRKMV
jgi:hypothetical protein